MMDKAKALEVRTEMRKGAGPRHTYIFECQECPTKINVRSDALKTHSGKCPVHSHRKRPFESIYNQLLTDHRKIEVLLTYEEFLEFTRTANCHYCGSRIPWSPYGQCDGEYETRAYFLDRKINSGPYSKENCVVCCTPCNWLKRDRDYNEFIWHCSRVYQTHVQRLSDLVDPHFAGSCGT